MTPGSCQHCESQLQGYGTLLMEAAERIAREEHRATKLAVISGVGTRHYYRRLGFELEVRPASGRPVSTCCELCTSQAVARLVCTACAGV